MRIAKPRMSHVLVDHPPPNGLRPENPNAAGCIKDAARARTFATVCPMALLGVHAAHAKWLFGLVSMAACAAGIAVACLPDLESTVIRTGMLESGAVCGNGFIESPEQCDPGKADTSVPGCTKDCRIDCEAGVSSFVDTTSNHCYFLLSNDAGTLSAAAAGCMAENAHVMTAGSTDEQTHVSVGLTPVPSPQLVRFWLGLDPQPPEDGGAFTYSSVIDEPGLANFGTCPGCYAPSGGDNHELFLHLDDADASADCITWRLGNAPLWSRANCESHFPTICEREPVGSRSMKNGCNQLTCFTVPRTAAEGKTYKWDPAPMTASKAAEFCSRLSNPAASLVVFGQDDPSHAQEEREQVFYELVHLPLVVAGIVPAPTDFWIGLTSSSTDAGITWTWDDGHLEDYFPLPWGNHEPKAKEPGVRAFSLQTGSSAGYEAPGMTYDTQLAHAKDPADGGADGGDSGDGGDGGDAGDAGLELHPVLCQQYSMTH
jgi:hypothetical protein